MVPRRPRTPRRTARLAPLLDRFQRGFDSASRLSADPVEFPRRYADPGDAEVAGIVAACLAYGRADVFKVKVEQVLAAGGPSPAAFAARLAREPDARALGAFRYRFNTGEDVAALLAAVGWARTTHGSLGSRFASLLGEAASGKAPLREALTRFAAELRSAPPAQEILRERGVRGLRHLCPDPGRAEPPSAGTCTCAGWCADPTAWTWESGGTSLRRSWSSRSTPMWPGWHEGSASPAGRTSPGAPPRR